MPTQATRRQGIVLSRTHRTLIGVVVAGAVVIAGIGFAGSYTAVRELAEKKGFGTFSLVFPIGIDAGIVVLLALDLLLTWIRIPFPLLRQTAWLLTAATIAFNGASSWPSPLGVAMHAVIPVLFVVAVEAARHAIGRIADITADKHMEGVRLTRWLLSPVPTFLLWRRMKLWELRSYEQVIKLEQERLVYQARLRSRYGRAWRRKAPVESLMPLRLARYGVPLADTAPAGLAAAGIKHVPLPPAPAPDLQNPQPPQEQRQLTQTSREPQHPEPTAQAPDPEPAGNPWFAAEPEPQAYEGDYDSTYEPMPEYRAANEELLHGEDAEVGLPSPHERAYFEAFRRYVSEQGDFPNARRFGIYLLDLYGVTGQSGGPLGEDTLRPYVRAFRRQYEQQQRPSVQHDAPAEEAASETADSGGAVAGDPTAPGASPEAAELLPEQQGGEGALGGGHGGVPAGAAADRTGSSSRAAVQMRIPAPHEPASEGADQSSGTDGEDTVGGEPAQDAEDLKAPDGLRGVALVEWYYMRLPEQMQALSANELAAELAEQTGYKEGTVRKYIGDLRRPATHSNRT